MTDQELLLSILKPWSWEDIWTCAARVRRNYIRKVPRKMLPEHCLQLACARILAEPGKHGNRIQRAAELAKEAQREGSGLRRS